MEILRRFFPKKEQPKKPPQGEVEDLVFSSSVEEAFKKYQQKIERLSKMSIEDMEKEVGAKRYTSLKDYLKIRRGLPL